jgi:hypothetical protein
MVEEKENVIKPNKYLGLGPISDLDKPVYFHALKSQLNSDNTDSKNIAITGIYGSGKSSIIESFLVKYPEFEKKSLRVSLATFCSDNETDTSNKTDNAGKTVKPDISINKVEDHILQQLFYQISYKDIPFSGFKKLIKRSKEEQNKFVVRIVLWVVSVIFIPTVYQNILSSLDLFSQHTFSDYWNSIAWFKTILSIATTIVFVKGLFVFVREALRLLYKGQLKRVTMPSADVELSPESTLNKHIDEIIYFFNETGKTILIIEDLDRFDNLGLFSKLREVNYLINNSPDINHTVKFVYAIRDNLFQDSLVRTKFFDFILPIVPIVNTTNSGDKLREFLKHDQSLSTQFLDEIGLFIHDLRLLKNIVNEYLVFSKVLNKDGMKSSKYIFGLVLYKNIFIEEYGLENSKNGLLFKVFNTRKETLISERSLSLQEKKSTVESLVKTIENEKTESEKELRDEYVKQILLTHSPVFSINNVRGMVLIEDEELFKELLKKPTIQIGNPNNISRPQSVPLDFQSIQNAVDESVTYKERLEIVKKKRDGKVAELKKEIGLIQEQIQSLRRLKLASLIENLENEEWQHIILDHQKEDRELLAFLLRKGYIDENYHVYMSHFYEGALNVSDNEFLLAIKKREGSYFDLSLQNIGVLVNRIDLDEYEYKASLNKSLIIYLLKSKTNKNLERLDLLLGQFSNIENSFKDFILPIILLLQQTPTTLTTFLRLLVDRHYPVLWDEVDGSSIGELKKDDFVSFLLKLPNDSLKRLNENTNKESIKLYLENKSDFIRVFQKSAVGDLKRIISLLNLKFNKLDPDTFTDTPLTTFIYQNSHYEINFEMIKLMIVSKSSSEKEKIKESLETINGTCILNTDCIELKDYIIDHFEDYIRKVYLRLDHVQSEDELTLIYFIDNLKEPLLIQVLKKVDSQIQNLHDLENNQLWHLLFDHNCVEPNWDNVLAVFKKDSNELLQSIIHWLNDEFITSELVKQKLSRDNFDEKWSETINSLMFKIIYLDGLDNESYKKLISSFSYVFNKLDLSKIEVSRINLLIQGRKIHLNEHYYKLLIELGFIDELGSLIELNQKVFISDYKEYPFNKKVHLNLLSSKGVSIKNKDSIIEKIPLDNIDNNDIAKVIIEVDLSSIELNFETDKVMHLISRSEDEELQLRLFAKYIESLEVPEINSVLKEIGGEYKKATQIKKRPTWPNTSVNASIVKRLDMIEFIRSYRIDKDIIKIVARQN